MRAFDGGRATIVRRILIGLIVVIILLAGGIWAASKPLSEFAKTRLIESLKKQFNSDLDLKRLDVTVFPRVTVNGQDLVFRLHGRTDVPPLITMRKFSATASYLGLLRKHVSNVRLDGLEIEIPPRDHDRTGKPRGGGSKADFVVDHIEAPGTVLRTIPKDRRKEPLEYDIQQLHLQGAGPNGAMRFQSILTNAKPPGEIHSDGEFGPWDSEDPGGTPLQGKYTFENADLSVFKGIAGKLSSKGDYEGTLDRIAAAGSTDTPDFVVKVSGNPVHLMTEYHAIIDGTNGDTLLQPVNAHFGHSYVTASGGVEGKPGDGKTVSLDVTVKDGRLEDMLLLGVKAKEPAMTGTVSFHAKMVIPPGNINVVEKLHLQGAFALDNAEFTKLNIQEKVDTLSHRAQGDTDDSEASLVASDFKGEFVLDHGIITFQKLSFRMPGVSIALDGKYGLTDQSLDFHGTASLEAKLSQTTTGIKSLLLKTVDRLFEKKNTGAVIPIRISGTQEKPSFGLDLGRVGK